MSYHTACISLGSGDVGWGYLDGSGEEMAIMGKACSERGPVVKGEFWETFSELQARLEGIDFPPIGQNLLLLFREVESGGDCRGMCTVSVGLR